MTTIPQFTPAQEERFAQACAWCRNKAEVRKTVDGEYVHFDEGEVCMASSLRKQLERKPLDLMRESFESDQCPIDGNLKRPRSDWFCKGCWWALSKKTRNALSFRPQRSFSEWMQAKYFLTAEKEKKTGTHG